MKTTTKKIDGTTKRGFIALELVRGREIKQTAERSAKKFKADPAKMLILVTSYASDRKFWAAVEAKWRMG